MSSEKLMEETNPVIHPPTPALKNQLEITIESMEDVASRCKTILTDRSKRIIEELKLNAKPMPAL